MTTPKTTGSTLRSPGVGNSEPSTGASLVDALEDAAGMVAALLENAPDTSGCRAAGEWSVREAAVHLLAGTRMYATCLAGTPSPLGDLRRNTLAAFNAGAFLGQPEDRGPELACLLRKAVGGLASVALAVPSGAEASGSPWHAGMRQPAPFFVRTIVSELLLHGWDVAATLHHRWEPDEATANQASRLLLDVMPLMFNQRKAGDLEGSFWFSETSGREWGFEIHDGSLRMGGSPDADCRISGHSFEIMLWTSGRVEWAGSRLTARGPRATLALTLMGAFESL